MFVCGVCVYVCVSVGLFVRVSVYLCNFVRETKQGQGAGGYNFGYILVTKSNTDFVAKREYH